MKPVKLQLLGGFELARTRDPALPTRKAEGLLAYLAVPLGQTHRRDKLASLLWGERGDTQARHSLAQTVHVIRKALGESGKDALISNAHTVALDPSFIDLDVSKFEALAALRTPEACTAAMELYGGELLEGIGIREQAFGDWLLCEQRRLNAMALGLLERLLDHQMAAGDDKTAMETASRSLALDPLQESVHRTLMRLYRRAGQETAAIGQYQTCAKILRHELGIEPDAATQALYCEIVNDRAVAGSRVTPVRSIAYKPLVAVLPFAGIGGGSARACLRGGITDEIIAALSKVSGFSVISLDPKVAGKCSATDVKRLAHELGVQYVLKGSMRRSGTTVRVNTQLVDAASGSHLWADHYDGALKDFFALDLIAESISATVAVTLTQAEQNRAMRNQARNLPAYDYALRGAAYIHRVTSEDNIKAEEMFRSAIALDPDYAPAYAGLGSVLVHEGIFEWSLDLQKSLETALEYAKKASVLDDSLARVHTVLGAIYIRTQRHELAVAEGRRAVALEPTNPDPYESLAYFLIADGQAPEALEMAEKALRFNPANTNYFYFKTLAFAHYMLKHYEAAATAGEQAVVHNPTLKGARLRLAAAYAQLGRMDDARRHVHEVLRIDPGFSVQDFSNRVPLNRKPDRDHYFGGMRMAGLPE